MLNKKLMIAFLISCVSIVKVQATTPARLAAATIGTAAGTYAATKAFDAPEYVQNSLPCLTTAIVANAILHKDAANYRRYANLISKIQRSVDYIEKHPLMSSASNKYLRGSGYDQLLLHGHIKNLSKQPLYDIGREFTKIKYELEAVLDDLEEASELREKDFLIAQCTNPKQLKTLKNDHYEKAWELNVSFSDKPSLPEKVLDRGVLIDKYSAKR